MRFDFSINDFDNIVNLSDKKKILAEDTIYKGNFSNHTFESADLVINDSLRLTASEPEQYKLQRQIREAFGRNNTLNFGTIADHYDFNHLVHGGIKKQFITTMFVDIKGSTKLSLKYPDSLEFIYKFKNAVIKSCIEVIHAFDGHVHRIMGDAVLGFFGSSSISKPQSILDCINAGAMLTIILENYIKPWLKQQKEDFDINDFGFRIGCNFGDDDEVLWANYGFGPIGEVSPTGLPVDLAAKLQGLADTNQIMMGQGLLNFFNFPDNFSKIKEIKENYKIEPKEYIYPEYSKSDGTDLKYIMRILKTHTYILGFPLHLELKDSITKDNVNNNEKIIPNELFELSAEIIDSKNNKMKYYSNSKIIEKGSKIIATLEAKNINMIDFYKVVFYKKNQSGFNNELALSECLEEEIENNIPDKTPKIGLNSLFSIRPFERSCDFKGLHFIKCEVFNKKKEVIFRDYIYVPIE